MRKLRFIPVGGAFVEVVNRTLQGRFLLRPSAEVNEIIAGVVGRAQRIYGVQIIYLCWLSNHYHMLIYVQDARQMADFMGYLGSNIGRELGRLHGWSDKFWARRYSVTRISDEPEAQVERLRYCLAQGVKEGLVARAEEWPGVHGLGQILHGETLTGHWFDRTQEYTARQRGESFSRLQYAEAETITLSLLPCWSDLSVEEYRAAVASLVEEIEAEAAVDRRSRGVSVLGVGKILAQHPHDAPSVPLENTPAPSFHAFRQEVRQQLRDAYNWFAAAYREAAQKLRDGDLAVRFPEGSFPPAMPFVEVACGCPP